MSNEETPSEVIERTRKRLEIFFKDQSFSTELIAEGIETNDLFTKPSDVLPFLQTALLDEKVIEVEMDGMTRVYFSRIYDDPVFLEEEEDEEGKPIIDPSYNPGEYLQKLTHIIMLPIEPGIGNIHIRHSKSIVLRQFMSSYAVELGCFFQDMASIADLPVLRLGFPVVGRIVRGAREYRAKVPVKHNLQIMIIGKRKQPTMTARVVDISASGCSFSIKKEEQSLFVIDEVRTFEFIHEGMLIVRLTGKVRHVSKIRGKKGTEFICGLQFDLVTRAIAAQVEGIVATVQRAHLKELSDLSEESGFSLKT